MENQKNLEQSIIDYIREHEDKPDAVVVPQKIAEYSAVRLIHISKKTVKWAYCNITKKYIYEIEVSILEVLIDNTETCRTSENFIFDKKGMKFEYNHAKETATIVGTKVIFYKHQGEKLKNFLSLL